MEVPKCRHFDIEFQFNVTAVRALRNGIPYLSARARMPALRMKFNFYVPASMHLEL
jgi:hypothetical protein